MTPFIYKVTEEHKNLLERLIPTIVEEINDAYLGLTFEPVEEGSDFTIMVPSESGAKYHWLSMVLADITLILEYDDMPQSIPIIEFLFEDDSYNLEAMLMDEENE